MKISFEIPTKTLVNILGLDISHDYKNNKCTVTVNNGMWKYTERCKTASGSNLEEAISALIKSIVLECAWWPTLQIFKNREPRFIWTIGPKFSKLGEIVNTYNTAFIDRIEENENEEEEIK